MPKSNRLTTKQTKFIKGIAEGKTGTQSALDAYHTTDNATARAIASENLTKPTIQQALEQTLDRLNLTPEKALQPILDALEHHNLDTRLKGSDRALKIMFALKEKQDKEASTGQQINVTIDSSYNRKPNFRIDNNLPKGI
jgi:phage terminase small subunit